MEFRAQQWGYVFQTSVVIEIAALLFYGIFASGELQPWSGIYKRRQATLAKKSTTSEYPMPEIGAANPSFSGDGTDGVRTSQSQQ